MKQAADYLAEVECLAAVVADLSEADLLTPTQFKSWTIEDVIGHLHLFDHAALVSLQDPDRFPDFWAPLAKAIGAGQTFIEMQQHWLGTLSGHRLIEAWTSKSGEVADAYAKADPKARVVWVGPSMSARSSITARQMETWAHGHEVFDILGQHRQETDRIYNICHMGVATFGWSFANRGSDVPGVPPAVLLTSPSGIAWEWNTDTGDGVVSGSAVEFAQVVTQTRNVRDTSLNVAGESAEQWMQIAQCFAGPVGDPPAKGTRFVAHAH